jgi:peptidoglycan-N-acetylglucosamine deacetylase
MFLDQSIHSPLKKATIGYVNGFIKEVLKSLMQSRAFPLEIIWKGKMSGKKLALTFDDGPDPNHTPKLLDALTELDVVATFFLLACKANNHSSLVKEIRDRGHEIGNHSFDHNKFKIEVTKNFTFQIENASQIFERIVGIKPKLFRPPYGILSTQLMIYCIRKKIALVMWSLDSRDSFKDNSLDHINAFEYAKTNDILLLHDDSEHSIEIVLKEIPLLIEKGFSFVPISSMLESLKLSNKSNVRSIT